MDCAANIGVIWRSSEVTYETAAMKKGLCQLLNVEVNIESNIEVEKLCVRAEWISQCRNNEQGALK